jgi:hypothetical protein
MRKAEEMKNWEKQVSEFFEPIPSENAHRRSNDNDDDDLLTDGRRGGNSEAIDHRRSVECKGLVKLRTDSSMWKFGVVRRN